MAVATQGQTRSCRNGAKLAEEWLRFRQEQGDVQANALMHEVVTNKTRYPR